jgi:hypothetical protein
LKRTIFKKKDHSRATIQASIRESLLGGSIEEERKSELLSMINSFTVMKDLDFLDIEERIHLDERNSINLIKKISEATAVLEKSGIMDYSILLIKFLAPSPPVPLLDPSLIQESPDQILEEEEEESSLFSKRVKSISENDEIYSYQSLDPSFKYNVYIIDFLQTYDWKRFIEKKAKKLLSKSKEEDISAQNPSFYRNRMINFLKKALPNYNDSNNTISKKTTFRNTLA